MTFKTSFIVKLSLFLVFLLPGLGAQAAWYALNEGTHHFAQGGCEDLQKDWGPLPEAREPNSHEELREVMVWAVGFSPQANLALNLGSWHSEKRFLMGNGLLTLIDFHVPAQAAKDGLGQVTFSGQVFLVAVHVNLQTVKDESLPLASTR